MTDLWTKDTSGFGAGTVFHFAEKMNPARVSQGRLDSIIQSHRGNCETDTDKYGNVRFFVLSEKLCYFFWKFGNKHQYPDEYDVGYE